jgi:hypothetical protein
MGDMSIKKLLAGAAPARMLDSSMTILFPLPDPLRAGYQPEIRAPWVLNSFTYTVSDAIAQLRGDWPRSHPSS